MFNFSLAANLCFKDIFLSPKSSVKIQKTFFYTLQALYFGRFSVFAEQWVIYFIILVMILVKCFLPDEKPEIIPFPLQSVSDKGDFTFNKATLISVENEKQAMIARELTDLFTLSAGFTPEIKIQDKRANIIFRTDKELAAEHYKLNIST